MILEKNYFFQNYIEKNINNRKRPSLSKELFFLKKIIEKETNMYEGRRLYQIAKKIYFSRKNKLSCCLRIFLLFKNVFTGIGFTTPKRLFQKIELLSKRAAFHRYSLSDLAVKEQKKTFVPRKLFE